MKRWGILAWSEVENEKVDAFLREIIEVSRRHGLTISHEDSNGSFVVEGPSETNEQWMMNAADGVTPKIPSVS